MKKFPNAFVIIMGAILLAWCSTFFIPTGSYQRIVEAESGRTNVIPGSFEQIEAEPLGFFDLMMAIPNGLKESAELIILILLVGGCFYLIEKTGVLGQALERIIRLMRGQELLALVLVSVLFAAAGASIGLQEEIIAMAPILIAFSRSMGFNALVAISISYGAAVVGAAFSPMNPFAVVLAQKEAQLPLLSGSEFRLVAMGLALVLWIGYILWYARKNRVSREPMAETVRDLSIRPVLILVFLCLTFSIVTYGLLSLDWGLNEITACFFVLAIAAGLLSGMGLNRTGLTYIDGMKEMVFPALIMGLAKSIPLILAEGNVIDTIIFGLFTPMKALPTSASALGMMVSQALLHLPVSSYSAQAVLTMPVLVPLSDLVGVSRQVCVLAYQYGAVTMDMIVPTNGALMGILAIAHVSYNKWLRFIWKPALIIFLLAGLTLVTAVFTGF